MPTSIHALRASLAAALLVLTASTLALAAQKGPHARALERAIALLPALPNVPIRLIDPELAPGAEAIRQLDAFIVREADGRIRPAVYLNSESSVVVNALSGRDIDIAILAAVIRHELEHLRGAGEEEARRVEMAFFKSLILGGRIPSQQGLEYLSAMTKQYRHEAHQ
jgi:hypothetical protein